MSPHVASARLSPGNFSEDVMAVVRLIPKGRVASYGDVAERAGYPRRRAREVGWVLARCDPRLEWYRVIRQDGSLPLRPGGPPEQQAALLSEEGIEILPGPRVEMARYRWKE